MYLLNFQKTRIWLLIIFFLSNHTYAGIGDDSETGSSNINRRVSSPLNFAFGSFLGSSIGTFVAHGFDTVATRRFALTSKSYWETSRAFLRSCPTVLIGIVPTRVATMTTYGAAQRYIDGNFDRISPEENKLASSLIAGGVLSIASAPAEFLKTKQQLLQKNSSFLHMLQTKQLPINSLYNTFLPLSIRATSSAVFLLAGTEYIQKNLPVYSWRQGPLGLCISTSIAAFSAQTVMLPFENARIAQINNGLRFRDAFFNLVKEGKIYRTYALRSTGLSIQSSFTILFAYLGDDFLSNS